MSRFKTWLSVLLLIQALLAAALFWSARSDTENPQQLLLAFAADQLTRIVISDTSNTVTLVRAANAWWVSGAQEPPADQDQVNTLIATLGELKAGWPVATTAASHARFEVSADKYQRRVQLYTGETLVAELLVGTSPGFRTVHARLAGADKVYVIRLNTFDLPVKADDWLFKAPAPEASAEQDTNQAELPALPATQSSAPVDAESDAALREITE